MHMEAPERFSPTVEPDNCLRSRSGPLARCLFTIVLLLIFAAPSFAQITITRVSDPKFSGDAVGANAPSPVLSSAYVAYQVTNSGAAIVDAWVTIDNFSDVVIDKASTEDGLFHIGSLASGASKFAYFYLTGNFSGAAATATVSTTHRVSVYSGRPPGGTSLQNTTFTLAVGPGDVVQANANKVVTGTVPASLSLGSTFDIVVNGETGTIDTPRS